MRGEIKANRWGKTRRFLSLATAALMVAIFWLIPKAAEAKLSIGGFFSYGYPLGFGEINDAFEEYYNSVYGTSLGFKTGTASGIEVEYSISPGLVIRGETFNLESNTADSRTEPSPPYTTEIYYKGEAKASSIFLSLVGKPGFDESFSIYAGAGVGAFDTELETSTRWVYYLDGAWSHEEIDALYSRDKHWGFQFLGGAEYRIGKNLVLQGEARVLFSTSAMKEEIGREVSWDSFFLSLGVGYRF
jgi:opacity protein-like surface antigen